MPYQIEPELSAHLLQQPEYGMGYQLATAPPMDGGGNEPHNYAIINATWALSMTEDWLPDPDDLRGFDDYLATLASASSSPRPVVLVENPVAFSDQFPFVIDALSLLVHGSFEATVHKLQRFRRFSAFSNDRRIRPDSTLRSGTYVTSVNDADHVNTGLSAVARYALPIHAPAIFRFDVTIRPEKPVTLVCGTVKPAYDQSGGGIEFRILDDGQAVASKQPTILPAW